jgi:lipopolysaccharide export system protein LptA
VNAAALALALALGSLAGIAPAGGEAGPAPPVRIECEGPLEWRIPEGDPGSGGSLRLSGGVRLVRGEMELRSRTATVAFGGGDDPDTFHAEGDVRIESRGLTAAADVAVLTRPPGDGDGARLAVALERRRRQHVELRAGGVVILCRGRVTYDPARGEALLAGGVTARPSGRAPPGAALKARPERAGRADAAPGGSQADERRPPAAEGEAGDRRRAGFPALVLCDRARVRFGAPRETAGAGRAEKREPAPGARSTTVEEAELLGNVVVEVEESAGGPARRVRAARAEYDAARRLVVFGGEPSPVVEYRGVVLTAPEIVLHLDENRVSSPRGKMKAVVGPGG